MRMEATKLADLFVLAIEERHDERGFFARSFCQKVFAERGLSLNIRQSNISYNAKKATLRGLHFQVAPHEEPKLVRCTRGRIFDVAVDIRPQSLTRGQWFGVELSADNRRALFIPPGFAHGFQTLVDDSEVFYEMGEFFQAEMQRGIHWADPDLKISWPLGSPIVSAKDDALETLAAFKI